MRLAITVIVLAVAGCGRITREVRLTPDPVASVDELWQEPSDLERRDLFSGSGGPDLMPKQTTFTFVARDTSGWSPGFDVRSSNGLDWSVKLGREAQSEVVSSRILWAIGYHQPPTYYLKKWTLIGAESGPQPSGRFRPALLVLVREPVRRLTRLWRPDCRQPHPEQLLRIFDGPVCC